MVGKKQTKQPVQRLGGRTGPKQTQISEKAASKWKSLSGGFKEVAMVLFEDATNRCKRSGEENIEELISSFKERFHQRLLTLRVPDKKLLAERDIQIQLDLLQAENVRLQSLENSLTRALSYETSKVEKLQRKAEQLGMTDNKNRADDDRDNEIHTILKKVLEEN